MLYLSNSLDGQKKPFSPLVPHQVTLYVCGPTVYNRIHLGNARSIIVFDILYRLLRALYPSVLYVRNITDVDDKINEAAQEKGIDIYTFTRHTTAFFHKDIQALYALPPTHEPRATDYIPFMITLIQSLIDKGTAYEVEGHVLFSVDNFPAYGSLSHKSLDQMKSGARVEVAPYKRNPLDFVLWKPSEEGRVGWSSPWGYGRPGWHIECSAMSRYYLGPLFDIHGGGSDLLFPHHENERAQSCAASGESECARYWVHNSLLLVDGQKMSKSVGNFITVQEALSHHHGEAIRWALLSSHYRHPLDWTGDLLTQAYQFLHHIYQALDKAGISKGVTDWPISEVDGEIRGALEDNLNTPKALHKLRALAQCLHRNPQDRGLAIRLQASAQFMGFIQNSLEEWMHPPHRLPLSREEIEVLITKRHEARRQKDYSQADAIRAELLGKGVILEDVSSEKTVWRFE